MVNILIHQFLPGGAVVDQGALEQFQKQWKTYQKLVDADCLSHEKAAKLLDAAGRASLAELLSQLEAAPAWQAPALEALVRTYAERMGAKLGKVAQPLRVALTGSTVSPPVFDVMAVLGREEALARIRDQAR
jgi:glutamyl/glutaminyl-tRNA synthetase